MSRTIVTCVCQLQLFQSLTQLIRRVLFEGLASFTNIATCIMSRYVYVCSKRSVYSNSLFFFCVAKLSKRITV